jgi:hypothetical protein
MCSGRGQETVASSRAAIGCAGGEIADENLHRLPWKVDQGTRQP